MAKNRIAFADESGSDWNSKCYAIGAVSFDEDRLNGFNKCFEESRERHGVADREIHWNKLSNTHGLGNFCIEWLHRILTSKTARFDVMVVNTALFNEWTARGGNREEAFYKTYTELLKCLPRDSGASVRVLIDNREDSYSKRDEAMLKIGNNMLQSIQSAVRLSSLTKVSSKEHPGIQVADILTGAIRTAHALQIDPKLGVSYGKRVVMERMARVVGWVDFASDTLPPRYNKSRLNIWHFPFEYRGPSKVVELLEYDSLPWILPEDLIRPE